MTTATQATQTETNTYRVEIRGLVEGRSTWCAAYRHLTHAEAVCLEAECARHGDTARIVDEATGAPIDPHEAVFMRNALTQSLTAFSTYAALLTACRRDGYRPGLWPLPRHPAATAARARLAELLRADGCDPIIK